MENKINIAELLKDCPKDMELDCSVFEDVTLYKIDTDIENEFPIRIKTKNDYFLDLTKYGTYANIEEAKCVIFPKGKTTWEGFVPPCQFKDGDIVYIKSNKRNEYIIIFKRIKDEFIHRYVSVTHRFLYTDKCALCHLVDVEIMRLATEEEKQKLFDAIKANGYRWDEETKTLEKLPMFKDGDVIVNIHRKHLHCDGASGKISQITDDKYIFTDGSYISISNQDDWELVSNKFDITILNPFDKVICRDNEKCTWRVDFYSHYESGSEYWYVCAGDVYKQCIPYNEETANLVGTTNDCPDKYKSWKDER